MPKYIEIPCPSCGHKWNQNMAQAEEQRVIYKRVEAASNKKATYIFDCPNCGEKVVVELPEAQANE